MVMGKKKKFLAAFIVPAFAFLKDWCARHNVPFTSQEDVVKQEAVKNRIMKEVDAVNSALANYEQIKKIELLSREWTIDRGEMTPKLSMKRKIIMGNEKAAYERIYGQHSL